MNISRYMSEDAIKLEMETVIDLPEEGQPIERWREQAKSLILLELVDLLDETHRVGNRNKLLIDFVNREKKAGTAVGHGVAFPHIRSMQATEFMMAFARSSEGYDFGAPDSQPVKLFFVMAAPPYDDNLYLKVFKALAEMLQYESFRQDLLDARYPGEVLRIIRAME